MRRTYGQSLSVVAEGGDRGARRAISRTSHLAKDVLGLLLLARLGQRRAELGLHLAVRRREPARLAEARDRGVAIPVALVRHREARVRPRLERVDVDGLSVCERRAVSNSVVSVTAVNIIFVTPLLSSSVAAAGRRVDDDSLDATAPC